MRAKQVARAGVVVLALTFVVSGCSQPLSTREKGTLAGGGLGAFLQGSRFPYAEQVWFARRP